MRSGLGIFEMASLDGLLPECFTSVIMSEVVELNIGPDRLIEMIWLTSTSFGLRQRGVSGYSRFLL